MILAIKAKPNSRQNKFTKEGDNWVVRVTAAPQDGEANDAIIRFLADTFKVPKSRLVIVSGSTSPFKRIKFPDEYAAQVTLVLNEFEGSGS